MNKRRARSSPQVAGAWPDHVRFGYYFSHDLTTFQLCLAPQGGPAVAGAAGGWALGLQPSAAPASAGWGSGVPPAPAVSVSVSASVSVPFFCVVEPCD